MFFNLKINNMIFLILIGIIGLVFLFGYIRKIHQNLKIQDKIIQEQRDIIDRERIAHKYTKSNLDTYVKAYNQVVDQINQINGMEAVPINVTEYDMDDILKEISIKGIKNVSKDKLEFLKKIGK